jgi:hypothetical protein
MKRLAIVLLAATSPAFALHVISDPYPATATQPTSFNLYCPSTSLTPALASTPDSANGNRLYQDLTVTAAVPCQTGTAAVTAVDSLGRETTRVNFSIPAAVTAPTNVRVAQ